jgi:hypothetical protein
MDLKPSKGLKVVVNATREAIFGDEALAVKKVAFSDQGSKRGVLTGSVLAGYCEVEMPSLDKARHWYPVDQLAGEKGEKIVEEEVTVEIPEDEGEE